MKVLLDTHVFLWYYSGALELSAKSRSFIDQSETLNLSIASLWEIGIKHSLGKLDLGAPIEHFFEDVVAKGFPIVGISPSHVLRVSTLPFHHRDPFDRLIIAQALVEDMVLVSQDGIFELYTGETGLKTIG